MGYYACGRGHPVFAIPPRLQQEFLIKSSESDIKHFFKLLESEDDAENQKAQDMAFAIVDLPPCIKNMIEKMDN